MVGPADKLTFLKLYFSNYFNVDVIDQYKTNSNKEMNWNWYITLDKEFIKSIEMKKPEDLLNSYFCIMTTYVEPWIHVEFMSHLCRICVEPWIYA